MAGKAEGGPRKAQTVAGSDEETQTLEKPLRPGQCREYMRRELAREFRGIVQGFVKGAKSGSCQHVKLATELVAAPPRAPKREKSAVRQLIEEMEGRGRL